MSTTSARTPGHRYCGSYRHAHLLQAREAAVCVRLAEPRLALVSANPARELGETLLRSAPLRRREGGAHCDMSLGEADDGTSDEVPTPDVAVAPKPADVATAPKAAPAAARPPTVPPRVFMTAGDISASISLLSIVHGDAGR